MKKLKAKYKNCEVYYDGDMVFTAEGEDGSVIYANAVPDCLLDERPEDVGPSRQFYYRGFVMTPEAIRDYRAGRICLRTALELPEIRHLTCDQFFACAEKGTDVVFVEVDGPAEDRDLPNYGVFVKDFDLFSENPVSAT